MSDGLMHLHRRNLDKNGTEMNWGESTFVDPKTPKVTETDDRTRVLPQTMSSSTLALGGQCLTSTG